MLFAVIYCTGTYGGAITAILFNIPGAPENAPTAFDGYPMTRKGLAGKAVGAAVLCSAIGGTASALVMMAATEPLAQWAIRNIGPPEILPLFSLALLLPRRLVATPSGKAGCRFFLACLIATIGQDPVGGINRYNFGLTDLAAGIAFVPAILGFFAVSEILFRRKKEAFGKHTAPKFNVDFPTIRELWRYKIAVVRSIFVGFFCGILPGLAQHLPPSWAMAKRCAGQKTKSHLVRVILKGLFHLKRQ